MIEEEYYSDLIQGDGNITFISEIEECFHNLQLENNKLKTTMIGNDIILAGKISMAIILIERIKKKFAKNNEIIDEMNNLLDYLNK